MEKAPSYWMLADTEVPLAWDPTQLDRFATYFKHALLFNERLMLSDAQAVNCMNFRRLLGRDEEFRGLLQSDVLSIAVRAPEHSPKGVSLTYVRDAFVKEGKQRTSNDDEFLNNSDLDLIDRHCDVRLYDYGSLRNNYTQSVLNIFTQQAVKEKFGEADSNLILSLLERETARNEGLGRVYLHQNLAAELKAAGKADVWGRHEQLIKEVSDAPYVTGIPTVMDAAPIYSPYHQKSFDLVYGIREDQTTVQDNKRISLGTDLNLSTYEQALALLPMEDIMLLRSSPQFKHYQRLSALPTTTESGLDDVLGALADYQGEIDRFIVARNYGKSAGRTHKAQRYITPAVRYAREGGVATLGFMLSDALSGGLLSISSFLAGEALDMHSRKSQQKFEQSRFKMAQKFAQDGSVAKIQANRQGLGDTLYSSIIR